MKAQRTLVAIADDEKARFFLNEGVGKGLTEVAGTSVGQFPDTTVEYADRPGRASGGKGAVGLHGIDPHMSLETLHRGRFALHVIDALNDVWRTRKPDRLVIAAPPKMLGELRDNLGQVLRDALFADLPKDLIKVPVHDLPGHFDGILVL